MKDNLTAAKKQWEENTLQPVLDRFPERNEQFVTHSDIDVERLYLPDEGDGPFPAVVLLHGCSGVAPRSRMWAEKLNSWGYATLIVDSFGPRWVIRLAARFFASWAIYII